MSSELITEHRAANSWSDQTADRRGEGGSVTAATARALLHQIFRASPHHQPTNHLANGS